MVWLCKEKLKKEFLKSKTSRQGARGRGVLVAAHLPHLLNPAPGTEWITYLKRTK